MHGIKERILELHDMYSDFNATKQQGIERMKDVLSKLGEVCTRSVVVHETPGGNLMNFHVFGINILVMYSIVISANLGCVRWYNIIFDPERQKDTGSLIVEYYFDKLGNIYKDAAKATCEGYSFQADNHYRFIYRKILESLDIVDQKEAKKLGIPHKEFRSNL